MNRGCAAKLTASFPIALSLMVGLACAQGTSTTVSKSSSPQATVPKAAPPKDAHQGALAPSIGKEVVAPENAAPGKEIVPEQVDEGASWQVAVEASKGPTPLIGKAQSDAVTKINGYFNGITTLEGHFEQIDASNKRSNGRFYVKRPGNIRFDYAPPSPLRIVADGHSLAIEDKSLKTIEKYPIKSTPFRLLLAKHVNLGRDAKIIGVERDNNVLAITLEDRKGTAGHIKLSFNAGSKLELRAWTITDAQGLTTRVTVKNLVEGRRKSPHFFKSREAPASPFQGMGG